MFLWCRPFYTHFLKWDQSRTQSGVRLWAKIIGVFCMFCTWKAFLPRRHSDRHMKQPNSLRLQVFVCGKTSDYYLWPFLLFCERYAPEHEHVSEKRQRGLACVEEQNIVFPHQAPPRVCPSHNPPCDCPEEKPSSCCSLKSQAPCWLACQCRRSDGFHLLQLHTKSCHSSLNVLASVWHARQIIGCLCNKPKCAGDMLVLLPFFCSSAILFLCQQKTCSHTDWPHCPTHSYAGLFNVSQRYTRQYKRINPFYSVNF